MNNKNTTKTTTLKTLLMLSIIGMMLIPGGIILGHAEPGDVLLTINNPEPGFADRFGSSVATTINGNILVGAWHDNTNATDAGSAYLFNGTDGRLLLTINNPTPEEGDFFGYYVATTINGNILVGADFDNTNATDTGSVYVFDPATCDSDDGTVDQTCNIADLTINNPTPDEGDYFGRSVASTINGNILVGALGDNTNATDAGSAYLFDGTDGSLLLTINNPTPEIDERFGRSVESTTNGNILVGAYFDNTGANKTGSAYLFNGTLRGTTSTPLLTINNPTPVTNDHFGYSVAGTTNGNILVGAYGDHTNATDAGSAYLFDGTDGSLLLTINNPTPEVNDWFGRPVAGTTNGNILVGARGDNTGADRAGSTYLFDGTDGSLLLTINNPTPEVGDFFGLFVVGTNNGNILVGARNDNTNATTAGSVYLFEGIYCGEPKSFYNVVNGTNSSDYLVGTNNPDLILGYAGNDMIKTRGDDNCIYAGDGNDFVFAANDGDIVYGGAGDDSIMLKGIGIAYGEDGNDTTYIVSPSAGHLIDGGNNSDLCIANVGQIINTVNCEIIE